MEQPQPFTAAELVALQGLVRTAEKQYWADLFTGGYSSTDTDGKEVPIEMTDLSYKLQQHIEAIVQIN